MGSELAIKVSGTKRPIMGTSAEPSLLWIGGNFRTGFER
jgi:hypothetical protein